MPLAIAPYGDTHDKDIALAIRYAVDNGAKVINMSFGKFDSLYKDWVFEAFRYAEKHDVLIVSSAGNYRYDLTEVNNYYPNDNVDNGKEESDNFLLIGGSSYYANETLKHNNSNFGNIDVDIFAPAVDIYTTLPNNEYTTDTGTSLAAALTSKVAALIFSHYPKLTASQVKHIIIDSGVEYTFPVKTPTREDKDKTTPFSELSKSGKVVNAYNALIMADSISRKN
jgi:subtilisin family serine protease